MKKQKAMLFTVLLSATLAGNAFASGPPSIGAFGFFSYVVESVLARFGDGSSCPIRQCTNCRPQDQRDEDGNCRPKD